jgi:hypothetical protein
VLRAVYQHYLLLVVDLVDHAELAATRGVQAFELTSQWLARSMGVLGDRT